jgi:hypothetical protein
MDSFQAPTVREGIDGNMVFDPLTYVRGLDITGEQLNRGLIWMFPGVEGGE